MAATIMPVLTSNWVFVAIQSSWCCLYFLIYALNGDSSSPLVCASLSGKNLANNGHSSYKCGSLAEPPEASAAGNFFLEGASASESDFA
jgi:hypothetical protein